MSSDLVRHADSATARHELEAVIATIVANPRLHSKLRALVIICECDHVVGEVLHTPAGLLYRTNARVLMAHTDTQLVPVSTASPSIRTTWQSGSAGLLTDDQSVVFGCSCGRPTGSLPAEVVRAALAVAVERRDRRVPVHTLISAAARGGDFEDTLRADMTQRET